MDIHPPEHPIRSVRDFLLQIFTITCGIVIALGLDSLVSGQREARLARETRADFVGEINDNLAKLKELRATGGPAEAYMDRAATAIGAALKHGKPADPGNISRSFATLRNAAWETAQATQALRLLSYPEARALATAYNHQISLNELNSRARDQWIALGAYSGDTDDLSDAELREALKQLRVARVYQLALDGLEDKLAGEYQSALAAVNKSK
jgi:hypothetical protein